MPDTPATPTTAHGPGDGCGELLWEHMRADPSFDEELRQAEAELAEGRGVPFKSIEAEASSPPVSGDALTDNQRAGLAQHLAATDSSVPTPGPALTFAEFARVNRERCEAPDGFGHPLNGWSRSDWFLAAIGELGEAANKAKKLNRERDGIPGNTESAEELRAGEADEIADAVIYLDLLAQSEGFDLGSIVASKFNRTSERIGAPHRLSDSDEPDLSEGWDPMASRT